MTQNGFTEGAGRPFSFCPTNVNDFHFVKIFECHPRPFEILPCNGKVEMDILLSFLPGLFQGDGISLKGVEGCYCLVIRYFVGLTFENGHFEHR